MSASIAIQVLPQVDSDAEVCRIVDEVIAYIQSTGLRHQVGPFETTIEGESYDQLMDIVKECQHVAVRAVERAKAYISGALGAMLDLGAGRGPMDHLFDLKGEFVQ